MTRRKPMGVSFEDWTDRLVREAQERGEFDDLPGAASPSRTSTGPGRPRGGRSTGPGVRAST